MDKKRKLNKSDIVNLIYEKKSNISKKDIKEILDLCIDIMKENLENGMVVNITNFATFKCVTAKAKRTYSFKNKSLINLPERPILKTIFSVSFIKKIRNKNAGK